MAPGSGAFSFVGSSCPGLVIGSLEWVCRVGGQWSVGEFLLFFYLVFFPFVILCTGSGKRSEEGVGIFIGNSISCDGTMRRISDVIFMISAGLFSSNGSIRGNRRCISLKLPSKLL